MSTTSPSSENSFIPIQVGEKHVISATELESCMKKGEGFFGRNVSWIKRIFPSLFIRRWVDEELVEELFKKNTPALLEQINNSALTTLAKLAQTEIQSRQEVKTQKMKRIHDFALKNDFKGSLQDESPLPLQELRQLIKEMIQMPTEQAIKTELTNLDKLIEKSVEEKAALNIQKCFRGYLARKAVLSRRLFPRYREQVENLSKEKIKRSTPRAAGGNTCVYLPKKVPEVALKSSGRERAVRRFHQMQYVREILQQQKCSHLIIPKAALYKDYLIEQRLPINAGELYNINLYLSQTHLFDEAVREITRMFAQASLDDLFAPHLFRGIPGIEFTIRYDNLPLYVEEKNGKEEGKIGLIDLEQIKERKETPVLTTDDLLALGKFFPLHVDIIKEEAKKLRLVLDNASLASLEKGATQGKNYQEAQFTSHHEWLKGKGISTNAFPPLLEVNPQRMEDLTHVLEKELLKINAGQNDLITRTRENDTTTKTERNFFIGDPSVIAKKLAKNICPLIISNLKRVLEKEKKKHLFPEKQLTDDELVKLRSPMFDRDESKELFAGVQDLLCTKEGIDTPKMRREAEDIAQQLLYVIMQELVKRGEIFSYHDSNFYHAYRARTWLRY